MALRGRLIGVVEALLELRQSALDLAARHVHTVMPGYTHTQHAQPISLGYYLLSAGDVLARDHTRLQGALAHCNLSPLGAGALTTTGFPIDREGVARRLGFAGLVESAYDAVSARDDVHEAAAALAILMTGLSRVATDLQSWNTAEFAFIELADQFSSVSSIMPQKKNPQALEYLKAAAAQVTGALTAVLAASKNTSYSDVNDGVSSINVPVLEAADKARAAIRVMRGVLETMTPRPEAMARAAADGYGTATELADVIVRETGLSFRKAHNIVGRVVREAIERGRTAPEITSADLDRASQALFGVPLGIAPGAVGRALDPVANLASRTVTGGPAEAEMQRMLAARQAALSEARTTALAIAAGLAQAERDLVADARRLAGEASRI
jgi:argininosuccinate lyase